MPIEPKNLTAQMNYRAAGNPPSTLPESAVSNFFPGLEFDFRNVWRRILVGVELHEASWSVVQVEPGSSAEMQGVAAGQILLEVAGHPVIGDVLNAAGTVVGNTPLEWSNSLADVVAAAAPVMCRFQAPGGSTVTAQLKVRALFDGAAIAKELAAPGELTQSLCSPWQADFRECGCFYWSASRPDYVNVEDSGAVGHSWMQRDRSAAAAKTYIPDNFGALDPQLITYEELYTAWEQHLRFVIGGQDEA